MSRYSSLDTSLHRSSDCKWRKILSEDYQSSICDSDQSTVQCSAIECNKWINMKMYVLKGIVTTTEVWYVLYMRWCIKWIYIDIYIYWYWW